MKRVGILLMVLAFVIMGIFIIIPSIVPIESSPLLKTVLQAALCNPGETLTAQYSEYDTPTSSSHSTDFSCQTSDQQSRPAGGRGILIGVVGFLVLFLSGMGIWSTGNARKKPSGGINAQNYNRSSEPTGANFTDSPGNVTAARSFKADHTPLTEELGELQSALDAGLITKEEFAAKRKDILSRL